VKKKKKKSEELREEGNKYFNNKEYQEAYKYYRQSFETNIDNDKNLSNLSYTCIYLNKYNEAKYYALKLIQINPSWNKSWGRLALIYEKQGLFLESAYLWQFATILSVNDEMYQNKFLYNLYKANQYLNKNETYNTFHLDLLKLPLQPKKQDNTKDIIEKNKIKDNDDDNNNNDDKDSENKDKDKEKEKEKEKDIPKRGKGLGGDSERLKNYMTKNWKKK